MLNLRWWKNLWEKRGSFGSYEVNPGALSDVGLCRSNNEDSVQYLVPGPDDPRSRRGTLAIVADGMGGHAAGEVASKMAIECITEYYYADLAPPAESIEMALHEANREIRNKAASDPEFTGMGTTCTALVLHNGFAYLAHAGDSRLYLVRDGKITLVSEDQSVAMQMVREGLISIEEARRHPDRNILMNVLGTKPHCDVCTLKSPIRFKQGDQFVLCSDGLFDLIEDEEINRYVAADEPTGACGKLIELARSRGGFDNITVGIFRIQPPGMVSKVSHDAREIEVLA